MPRWYSPRYRRWIQDFHWRTIYFVRSMRSEGWGRNSGAPIRVVQRSTGTHFEDAECYWGRGRGTMSAPSPLRQSLCIPRWAPCCHPLPTGFIDEFTVKFYVGKDVPRFHSKWDFQNPVFSHPGCARLRSSDEHNCVALKLRKRRKSGNKIA